MALFSITRESKARPEDLPFFIKVFFGYLFPLPFILLGGAFTYFTLHNLIEAEASAGWPKVTGTVQSSAVNYKGDGDDGNVAYANVVYTYTLRGQNHSANNVSFDEFNSGITSNADRIVSQYRAGQMVTVYYSPLDPSVAVLRPGAGWLSWVLPEVGGAFALGGLCFLFFLPKAFFRGDLS